MVSQIRGLWPHHLTVSCSAWITFHMYSEMERFLTLDQGNEK